MIINKEICELILKIRHPKMSLIYYTHRTFANHDPSLGHKSPVYGSMNSLLIWYYEHGKLDKNSIPGVLTFDDYLSDFAVNKAVAEYNQRFRDDKIDSVLRKN